MQKLYGYDVPSGYMGYVQSINCMRLFASYRDYVEYVLAEEE